MPDVERPKALHGRKANRAFISQELVLGRVWWSFLNDVEFYRGFGLSANCDKEVSQFSSLVQRELSQCGITFSVLL